MGIRLENSDHNTVTGNTCQGNTLMGINLDNSDENTVSGNTCQGNTCDGIYLLDSAGNTITGNTCQGSAGGLTTNGVYLVGSGHNTITGNTYRGNDDQGIYLLNSGLNTITGNTCYGNSHGIYLSNSSNQTIAGNNCHENERHGIRLASSDHNVVDGNEVMNNGLDADITYDGIHLATSDYNNIQCNTVRTTVAVPPPNRQRYGIHISNAACDGNLVKDNDLYQSGITALFNDAGTNTKLPELWVNSIFDDQDLNATLSNIDTHMSISMADGFDVTVRFNFRVPSDFHQLVRARVVVVPDYLGPPSNMRRGVEALWGLCGEFQNTGVGTIAAGDVAVNGEVVECLDIDAALAGITAGDHVGVAFTRYGSHVNDTVGDPVHLLQFWMQYV
ncbi:hypothetical protein ES703_97727 [subsurface metagenome]